MCEGVVFCGFRNGADSDGPFLGAKKRVFFILVGKKRFLFDAFYMDLVLGCMRGLCRWGCGITGSQNLCREASLFLPFTFPLEFFWDTELIS